VAVELTISKVAMVGAGVSYPGGRHCAECRRQHPGQRVATKPELHLIFNPELRLVL
jgi:hypothetical protein